jgi:four helix bundle protein
MGVKRLEDLDAFNLATAFKLEVYKLITEHPKAERDFKYSGEMREAVSSVESNLAEGWRRYRRRDMANFVRIALASLEEAKVRLRDGIHRGYFTEAECKHAFELGNRCGAATMALLRSLL